MFAGGTHWKMMVLLGIAIIVAGFALAFYHYEYMFCPHCGKYLYRNYGNYCQNCGKLIDWKDK